MNSKPEEVKLSDDFKITTKQGGRLSSGYTKEEADVKFSQIHTILYAVVLVLLVMVASLIIDSFHFNSATYKEYSEKVNTLNFLNSSNNELQNQNKQNQEFILKQQAQILELLNKK